MKNIINTSELQRKGLKEVFNTIEEYGEAFITNQRSNKTLKIVDGDNPNLLINIIKSLKRCKKVLRRDFGIDLVAIVGSYARGENKPDSDLDILIDYKFDNLESLYKLEDFLSKELRIKNIDILPESNVSGLAIKQIKSEAIYV